MEKRNIIWLTDEQIDEMEKEREKANSALHYFAKDEDDNHYYWFRVETVQFGYPTYRYYLGVEDEGNYERSNNLFWFNTTDSDTAERQIVKGYKTPQEVRDDIKENDFIYKV